MYKPRDKGEKSHAELKGPGENKKAKMVGKGLKKKQRNKQNNDDNNSSTEKPVCLRYCIVGKTP